MRRIFAVRRAACWVFAFAIVFVSVARDANAQRWNDSVSLALVNRAVTRRVVQLGDTGLVDYRASAHGYVTFLAQLGEGFLTPPKIVKADELELEVYWHAPNQSKQRIVGRRDTLLLPTDIAYHRDHLGIVQNNFGSLIRVGDGDEVRDVPHPLSQLGAPLYDFALTDSFAIGSGTQRIRVYEVKVRPKDDRQPRVVGAVYLDLEHADVVRMNLSFTRAALIDKSLEDLSVVLENRLVAGRFWLPSRQEIEIRRNGEWLDYPVRGIISGRWEISDYHFNLGLPPVVFTGPEYVQAPPAELRQYHWTGNVLDSLPPDVRAVTEPDIARVQAEARTLVRAQALERAHGVRLSARNASDFARFDRIEGLAVGTGLTQQFGGIRGTGVSATARARYGLDDHEAKGSVGIAMSSADGSALRLFAMRDFRDVGDVAERSILANTLAAQEFGSDYTDPYLVRAVGASVELAPAMGFHTRITGSYEWQSPLTIHAQPVSGIFEPPVAVDDQHLSRFALEANRPQTDWLGGTELSLRAEVRASFPYGARLGGASTWDFRTVRGVVVANLERPFGAQRLVTTTTIAGMGTGWRAGGVEPASELVYLGGPQSAPGYDYHTLVSRAGATEHVEWRLPAPFIPFSLGRFGRVPSQGSFAPFIHVAGLAEDAARVCAPAASASVSTAVRADCAGSVRGLYPSAGAAYLLPFDLIRIDVARGLARGGRWTFNVDVSREFWSIL